MSDEENPFGGDTTSDDEQMVQPSHTTTTTTTAGTNKMLSTTTTTGTQNPFATPYKQIAVPSGTPNVEQQDGFIIYTKDHFIELLEKFDGLDKQDAAVFTTAEQQIFRPCRNPESTLWKMQTFLNSMHYYFKGTSYRFISPLGFMRQRVPVDFLKDPQTSEYAKFAQVTFDDATTWNPWKLESRLPEHNFIGLANGKIEVLKLIIDFILRDNQINAPHLAVILHLTEQVSGFSTCLDILKYYDMHCTAAEAKQSVELYTTLRLIYMQLAKTAVPKSNQAEVTEFFKYINTNFPRYSNERFDFVEQSYLLTAMRDAQGGGQQDDMQEVAENSYKSLFQVPDLVIDTAQQIPITQRLQDDTLSFVYAKIFLLKNNDYMRLSLLSRYAGHVCEQTPQNVIFEWLFNCIQMSNHQNRHQTKLDDAKKADDLNDIEPLDAAPFQFNDFLHALFEKWTFEKDDPVIKRLPTIEQIYALAMNTYRPTPQLLMNLIRYVDFLRRACPQYTALFTDDVSEHYYAKDGMTADQYKELKALEQQCLFTLLLGTYEFIYDFVDEPIRQVDLLRERILTHCGKVDLDYTCFNEKGERVTTMAEIESMINLLQELNFRYKKRCKALFGEVPTGHKKTGNPLQDNLLRDEELLQQQLEKKMAPEVTPEEHRERKLVEFYANLKQFRPVFQSCVAGFPKSLQTLLLSTYLVTPFYPAQSAEAYAGVVTGAYTASAASRVQLDEEEIKLVEDNVYPPDYEIRNPTLPQYAKNLQIYHPEELVNHLFSVKQHPQQLLNWFATAGVTVEDIFKLSDKTHNQLLQDGGMDAQRGEEEHKVAYKCYGILFKHITTSPLITFALAAAVEYGNINSEKLYNALQPFDDQLKLMKWTPTESTQLTTPQVPKTLFTAFFDQIVLTTLNQQLYGIYEVNGTTRPYKTYVKAVEAILPQLVPFINLEHYFNTCCISVAAHLQRVAALQNSFVLERPPAGQKATGPGGYNIKWSNELTDEVKENQKKLLLRLREFYKNVTTLLSQTPPEQVRPNTYWKPLNETANKSRIVVQDTDGLVKEYNSPSYQDILSLIFATPMHPLTALEVFLRSSQINIKFSTIQKLVKQVLEKVPATALTATTKNPGNFVEQFHLPSYPTIIQISSDDNWSFKLYSELFHINYGQYVTVPEKYKGGELDQLLTLIEDLDFRSILYSPFLPLGRNLNTRQEPPSDLLDQVKPKAPQAAPQQPQAGSSRRSFFSQQAQSVPTPAASKAIVLSDKALVDLAIVTKVEAKPGQPTWVFTDFEAKAEKTFSKYENQSIEIQFASFEKTLATVGSNKDLLAKIPATILDVQQFAMCTMYSRQFKRHFVIDFHQGIVVFFDLDNNDNRQVYNIERRVAPNV